MRTTRNGSTPTTARPKLAPPLKWHGGKRYLAPWIIGMMPPRCVSPDEPDPSDLGWVTYVEPFGGGLRVWLNLDPTGISEVVSDADADLMNFWAVMKDPEQFARLQRRLGATPFSEGE